MPKHLFKIIFEDGSTPFFGGPSIHESHWMDIPDKPIKRLEYFIEDGEGLILEDFEAYLCFVEANPTILSSLGSCPSCGNKGKLSKKITKFNNNATNVELVARCTVCTWVGKVQDLINKNNSCSDKYIYIMGLKNETVTSRRITLNGKNGEDKYITGDITKRIAPLGKEYRGKPTNLALWKKGIK